MELLRLNKKKIVPVFKWARDLNKYSLKDYIKVENKHIKKTPIILSHHKLAFYRSAHLLEQLKFRPQRLHSETWSPNKNPKTQKHWENEKQVTETLVTLPSEREKEKRKNHKPMGHRVEVWGQTLVPRTHIRDSRKPKARWEVETGESPKGSQAS